EAGLAEVGAAGQEGEGGGQPGADAVVLEFGWGGGVVAGAAAGAGAEMAALLGDLGRRLGQLADLVPGGLGIVGRRVRGQGLVAALAVAGDEVGDVLDAFGR